MKRDASPGTRQGKLSPEPIKTLRLQCSLDVASPNVVFGCTSRTCHAIVSTNYHASMHLKIMSFGLSACALSLMFWKRVYRGSHLSMRFDVRLLSGPMSARIG